MRPRELSPRELLDEVEPLPYAQRLRRLAEHARALTGRPELRALLDGLAGLGQYERSLGVRLAVVANEVEHVTRAMADPDPDVSRYAINQAIRLGGPDDAVVEIVRTASADRRMAAYRAIRQAERHDLAGRLLDEVRERWGDREAAGLLTSCPAGMVAARLADLAYAVPNWGALARRHPVVVLDHAESVLAELPRPLRPAWWLAVGPGIEAAAEHVPERVITLLERHWTDRTWRCAGRLLDADLERTLALYLIPGREPQLAGLLRRRAVRRRLAALTDDRLGELGRAVREHDDWLVDLLLAVPPSRREAVFAAATEGVDVSQAVCSEDLLKVLPLGRRVAEARRMLGLRSVAGDPYHVLEVTAFLPYDEAEETLRAVTRRSDGRERANGYLHLIACAGRARDPEIVTRLMDALGRLRNEQDPVRLAAAGALAEIPPRLFLAAHVPALDRLVDDALAARDCSHSTRVVLARLAAGVFGEGARRDDPALLEYGLRVFERVTGHTGTVYLRPLAHVLRRGQEAVLGRRLAPYLAAEADHDRHDLAFMLAAALGRRGHDVPELQDALERALTAASDSDALRAIELWLEPPRTRGRRVEALLASDPSVVVIGRVFDVLAWQRTDLLDAALGRRAPVGRFAKKGVRRVPHARRQAVRRWTAAQREAYLGLMERVAGNRKLPARERAQAVRMMGEVPAAEAGRLRPFLTSDDALLRRAALTALPWTARPGEVLADLLAYAGGDDAHVAVYAAARAARHVRPAELPAALEPVLDGGKVTARKEAVRLLARHRAPGATRLLRDLWAADGQHKDVRVAIGSAVIDLLAEPEAWEVLRGAVTEAGDLAAPVLGTQPLAVPERWRAEFGELVVAATRAPDRRTRASAVMELRHWVVYAPGAMDRLAEIVCELRETANWQDAARGLVVGACSGVRPEALRAAVRTLAAAPAEPDAGADRDLPAAQRLAAVVTYVRLWHRVEREPVPPGVLGAADDLPVSLAAGLLAGTADWDAPRDVLARLVETMPGVLAAVETGEALAESTVHVPPERVLPHARWLAAEGETGALLATALAASCGPRSGWAEPWRELLRRVRAGDFPEAAHRARRVRTVEE
ncbi:hypothetical protein GCM10022224_088970 [Nonomuraea antimicrobica]|uniref:HEAT repeat-containing protein n=2 Tax=Nonomuraea antimicrobica TaxID=561173 RepID=A0ABP7DTF8_9ACTN